MRRSVVTFCCSATPALHMLAAPTKAPAQAPLRYFSWLDPEDRKHRPEDAVAEKDLVEITCIVFDSRQINYVDRGRIYLESITLAMETGEPRAALPFQRAM